MPGDTEAQYNNAAMVASTAQHIRKQKRALTLLVRQKNPRGYKTWAVRGKGAVKAISE